MANQTNWIIGIVVVVIIILAAFWLFGGKGPGGGTTTVPGGPTTVPGGPTTVPGGPTTTVSNALPTTTIPPVPVTGTRNVTISESPYGFTPNTMTVAHNTTVTFSVKNLGNYQHSFAISNSVGGGTYDTGYIASGATATLTVYFKVPGNYTYFSSAVTGGLNDQIHGLKGVLTVT